MKLNQDIIFSRLPAYYRAKICGPKSEGLKLGRPVLYESNAALEPGKLYVAKAGMLPIRPPVGDYTVVCIGIPSGAEWTSGAASLLVIRGENSVSKVFNTITEIYDYFDLWDQQLQEELQKGTDADFKAMLRLGSQVLENPVSVGNISVQKILHTKLSRGKDGCVIVEVDDTPKQTDPVLLEGMKKFGNAEQLIQVPFHSAVQMDGKYNAYTLNMFHQGKYIGCVTMDDSFHPFTDADFPLAEHFFYCFRKRFLDYLIRETQRSIGKRHPLDNLLHHHDLSVSDMEDLALHSHGAICFQLARQFRESRLPPDYICSLLSALLPEVYATLRGEEVLGLIKLRDGQEALPKQLEDLERLLQSIGYTCGVSNPFVNLQDFDIHMEQAAFALEQRKNDQYRPILYFRDYLLGYFLRYGTERMPISTLRSEGIVSLERIDQEKCTEYLKTLYVYLKNESNISKSAQELYLHHSSMQKRLNRIFQLTGEDFDEPDVKLYYRIYFRTANLFQDEIIGKT